MKKKILVIDDDPSILEVLRIILEENGFEVKLSVDGGLVEKLILSFQPQMLLLDIWLYNFNGGDLTRKLKSNPQLKNLPIILLSASNDGSKTALEVGANDFLSKPFNIDDLLFKINKYVNPPN